MRPPISLIALLLVSSIANAQQYQGSVPHLGFVPDSATAVRIAVAVWIPMYGETAIMAQQPFVAKLNDSVWTVTASPARSLSVIEALDGRVIVGAIAIATPVAKIAQRDARILEASEEHW
jgi:NTF2 fold immunity protein of polymorphic toxin system component